MEEYTLICPKCGRKVLKCNEKRTVVIKCRSCNRLLEFDMKNGKTHVKREPKRNCSSGMRFY